MKKILASTALYSIYLITATLILLYCIFWLPYFSQTRNRSIPATEQFPSIKHLPPQTLQKVGAVLTEKNSSFVRFDYPKSPGTIRICAIGDSFVYGAETGPHLDYPSQLQQLFIERGYKNIEVLNFGNNWHGFHQAYILWEDLARPMGCEIIITGPETFFTDRDTQINHSGKDSEPYYLHSLFVLNEKHDDVFRIDVRGETYLDRFKDYYRFFPRWQQLRYDFDPPPLFRAMLPRDQTSPNPFYYHDDREIAVRKTWDILLRKVAQQSRQVIVLHHAADIVASGQRLGLPNLLSIRMDYYNHFPHRAPFLHSSPNGNRRIAEILFNQLTGQNAKHYPAIITRDVTPSSPHPLHTDPLAGLTALEIWTHKQKLGQFISVDLQQPRYADFQPAAIINFRGADQTLLEGLFILLKKMPAEGLTVTLVDAGGQQHILGQLQSRIPALSLYEIQSPALTVDYRDNLVLSANHIPLQINKPVSLLVGDQKILCANPGARPQPCDPGTSLLMRAVTDGEALIPPQQAAQPVYLKQIQEKTYSLHQVANTFRIKEPLPEQSGLMDVILCKDTRGHSQLIHGNACPHTRNVSGILTR